MISIIVLGLSLGLGLGLGLQKDDKNIGYNDKIFVIGFNKTATTSIHNLFKKLNINSVHRTKPVLKHIDKYDAFTDGDHYNFEEYYKLYPNSLFILNTRPIYKWLVSRYKHAKSHNFKKCWCWPISDEKTNSWILDRQKHYKNILKFFSDKPNQLLIVNIEKIGYENAICKFIGKSHNNKKFKDNTRKDKEVYKIDDIKKNVLKCLKNLDYDGTELLLKDYDISNYVTYL